MTARELRCLRCGAVVRAKRSDLNIAPGLDYVAECWPCPEADEDSIVEYGGTPAAAEARYAARLADGSDEDGVPDPATHDEWEDAKADCKVRRGWIDGRDL